MNNTNSTNSREQQTREEILKENLDSDRTKFSILECMKKSQEVAVEQALIEAASGENISDVLFHPDFKIKSAIFKDGLKSQILKELK